MTYSLPGKAEKRKKGTRRNSCALVVLSSPLWGGGKRKGGLRSSCRHRDKPRPFSSSPGGAEEREEFANLYRPRPYLLLPWKQSFLFCPLTKDPFHSSFGGKRGREVLSVLSSISLASRGDGKEGKGAARLPRGRERIA